MSEQEERIFNAHWAYTQKFGNGSFPGVDSLPPGYDEAERLAELLERCVAEGKQVHELVDVREDDPDVLY